MFNQLELQELFLSHNN
jgi:hypothetical protein